MANGAFAGKQQETRHTLDPEGLMPNVTQGEMRVLLRIYGENEVGHTFAIQTKDGRLLGRDGKELMLRKGTYEKNYNWSQLYTPGRKVDPYNTDLWWMGEETLAGKVRTQYADLKWSGNMQEGDQLLVYQLHEKGKILETGVAKQRGKKLFRNDGTQIEGEFYKLYIDKEVHDAIISGKFNPAEAGMKKKWVPPIMDALWERPKQGTQETGVMGQTVKITFYYVPHQDDARFGGSLERVKEAGALNGTYKDGNGVYWLYSLKEQDFVKLDKGPRTSTGTVPIRNITFAVPPEWRNKYIVIVQDGKILTEGRGTDTGSAFTARSGKIDVFTGEGQKAYEYGLKNYNGTGTVYAFNTKEEMEEFKKNYLST